MLEGPAIYSEYVIAFPAHRTSASISILGTYIVPVSTEMECGLNMAPTSQQKRQRNGTMMIHFISHHPEISILIEHYNRLLKISLKWHWRYTYVPHQKYTWRGYYLPACRMYTEPETFLECYFSDGKNTSVQVSKFGRIGDSTYYHPQWHTMGLCTYYPCKIRGPGPKGNKFSRRQNKDTFRNISYDCYLST